MTIADNNLAEYILKELTKYTKLKHEQLISRNRAEYISYVRHLASYLIYENCSKKTTYSDVSLLFKRHHATAIHSCNLIKDLLTYDKFVNDDVDYMNSLIKFYFNNMLEFKADVVDDLKKKLLTFYKDSEAKEEIEYYWDNRLKNAI